MTKITIDLNEEQDRKLKHILAENNMSKAKYIERVMEKHLNENIINKTLE